eukprot:SAG11_NODE_4888_length_1732_cov_30.303123_2_plen_420_part_00
MSSQDFMTESQVPHDGASINQENQPPTKRPASGSEIAADRLIAELMQDRAESRAVRQQQGELLRQNQELIAIQREQLKQLREQAAAGAPPAPIVNVQPPVVNVPAPVVNMQAAAAGQAVRVGAAPDETVLPKDLLKLVDDAVAAVTRDLNTANRARASLESLEALRIDADPSVPLPDGTPKVALQIRAPSITLPAGIEDEDFLATVQVPLQTAKRKMQQVYVEQLIASKKKVLQITAGRIDNAEAALTAAISDLLADTVLGSEHKTELGTAALRKFRADKTAAIDKIEAARKAEVKRKAKAAQDLEAAKLEQLETDNHLTVGALVDAKIAAERARRGSEEIDIEPPDQHALLRENAEAERLFRKASPAANEGGRQNRGKQNQQRKKQQQPKQTKQKGKGAKGNNKGKGASKGAGRNGGR